MSRKRRLEDLVREGELRRRRLAEETGESKAAAKDAGKWAIVAGVAAVTEGAVEAVSRRRKPRLKDLWRSLRPRPLPIVILLAVLRSEGARALIARGVKRFLPPAPPPRRREPPRPPAVSPQNPARRLLPGASRPQWPADRHPRLAFDADLIKRAFREWRDDDAMTLGAALAYYAIFSMAPLLVIAIAVSGIIFGADEARRRIVAEISGFLGTDAAGAINGMIAGARRFSGNVLATILGVLVLALGATGFFGHLQQSINRIWNLPPRPPGGLKAVIRDRFLSMTMVLGTGFLLLVSLVISAGLSAAGDRLGRHLPHAAGFLFAGLQAIVSWAVVGVLFAAIFKFLPDTEIAWIDVWVGAAVTALLFSVGQFAIGLYLGRAATSSVYGGAGALAVVLLWTYYSSLLLFFGAEITQVYSETYGTRIGGD